MLFLLIMWSHFVWGRIFCFTLNFSQIRELCSMSVWRNKHLMFVHNAKVPKLTNKQELVLRFGSSGRFGRISSYSDWIGCSWLELAAPPPKTWPVQNESWYSRKAERRGCAHRPSALSKKIAVPIYGPIIFLVFARSHFIFGRVFCFTLNFS